MIQCFIGSRDAVANPTVYDKLCNQYVMSLRLGTMVNITNQDDERQILNSQTQAGSVQDLCGDLTINSLKYYCKMSTQRL